MGDMRKANKILVWKPEGNRPLGRPKIKVKLRETGWKDVD
jgi:hypothetical protein